MGEPSSESRRRVALSLLVDHAAAVAQGDDEMTLCERIANAIDAAVKAALAEHLVRESEPYKVVDGRLSGPAFDVRAAEWHFAVAEDVADACNAAHRHVIRRVRDALQQNLPEPCGGEPFKRICQAQSDVIGIIASELGLELDEPGGG